MFLTVGIGVLLWAGAALAQTSVTFSVTGRGTSGTEVLEVWIGGANQATVALGSTTSTYSAEVPSGTQWEDVTLIFPDAPGLDLIVTGFSLDGDLRSMIVGDVLVSGQWTGAECSTLGDPIGETIHCNAVIQFPASDGGGGEPPAATLDESYWGDAQTVVPVYDTAWDMGVQVTVAQGEEYMDFLVDAGFSGFATTYLGAIHRPAARTDQLPVYTRPDALGNPIATWDDATGNLVMDLDHADHFEDLLDAAHDRGLRVMLLVFWERKSVEEYGLLNEGNSYDWAFQIGDRFKDHPAIQSWTLGGDAGLDDPRTQLWTNAVAGLRDAGVTGDINFHTGSAPARRVNQLDAEWNTGQLVQTSHCAGTELATSRLVGVMAQSSIPVWAGESRYEGIDATWCNPPVTIPTAQDIVDDARSFVDAGVAGILYGHNERWQWGHGLEGSGGLGWDSVKASFAAPGAYALIDALSEPDDPTATTTTTSSTTSTTTTTTTVDPPDDGPVLLVRARGATGEELLTVRAAGDVVGSFAVSTSFADFEVELPVGSVIGDVEVAFTNDAVRGDLDRNLIVDFVELDGVRFDTASVETSSTGTYNSDTRCNPSSVTVSETLHCNGEFSYA